MLTKVADASVQLFKWRCCVNLTFVCMKYLVTG